MNPGILAQIVFPAFLLWFAGLILVMLRRDLSILWKVLFVFIFVFYFFQFFPEISEAYDRLQRDYPSEILQWIYGISKAFYFFLLIIWPLTMVRVFYSASQVLSRIALQVLVSVTLTYWILFMIVSHFQKPIIHFLENDFVRWIRL